MIEALITGCTGQDGSYLTEFLLGKNSRGRAYGSCLTEFLLDKGYEGVAGWRFPFAT
jgi:GDP-D-mannose dehydratase